MLISTKVEGDLGLDLPWHIFALYLGILSLHLGTLALHLGTLPWYSPLYLGRLYLGLFGRALPWSMDGSTNVELGLYLGTCQGGIGLYLGTYQGGLPRLRFSVSSYSIFTKWRKTENLSQLKRKPPRTSENPSKRGTASPFPLETLKT